MSEKKILVPKGMLNEACRGTCVGQEIRWSEAICQVPLEAALRWLSQNPIVPSDDWIARKLIVSDPELRSTATAAQLIREWQGCMFLAPEKEADTCPAELALKNAGITISYDWLCPKCERVHRGILAPQS
jgi:hypothetical protein